MSAIMISQIKVTDPQAFQSYMAKTQEVAASYNAKLLFRGKMTNILNGNSGAHEMVVIVTFPDMKTLNSWYASAEYQALIPLRDEGSDQLMISYEEIV